MTKKQARIQWPKMSRKPSTLAGLTICETISPRPKSRPGRRRSGWQARLTPDDVMGENDGDDGGRHEDEGGRDRARRSTPMPQNAMAAGTPRPQAAAEAEQARGDEDTERRVEADGRQRTAEVRYSRVRSAGRRGRPHAPTSPWLGCSRPPRIPLMPAMRPLSISNRAEDVPIRTPPTRAETGVKFSAAVSGQSGCRR